MEEHLRNEGSPWKKLLVVHVVKQENEEFGTTVNLCGFLGIHFP